MDVYETYNSDNTLSDEEITEALRKGAQAEQLLESEAFRDTLQDLRRSLELQTFHSEPHENELRQNLYFQHVALQMIEQTLHARVVYAEQLKPAVLTEHE